MRKLISILLALAVLLLPAALGEESAPEFEAYNGVLSAYNGPGGDVVIPSEINGEAVRIYQVYKSMDETITGLTMPDTLEAIASMTLTGMYALERLVLPEGLKVIANTNICDCGALTEVTVPATVRLIGDSNFNSCSSLASVTFLGAPPVILDDCFTYDADDLVVYVPDDQLDAYREALPDVNLQPSGQNALPVADPVAPESDVTFDPATGTITGYVGSDLLPVLPGSVGGVPVKAIGSHLFANCPVRSMLFGVIVPDGVETIADEAIEADNRFAWVGLPDSVKTIGNGAFKGYWRCASFVAPDSLESLGDEAFANSLVRNVYLPGTIRHIGSRVFAYSAMDYLRMDVYDMIDIAPDAFENSYISDLDLPWDSDWDNRLAYQALLDSQVEDCTVWINNPPNVDYVSGDYEYGLADNGNARLISYSGDQESPYLHYTTRLTVNDERVRLPFGIAIACGVWLTLLVELYSRWRAAS